MNTLDDNELMLALHDLFESVEKQRKMNAATAYELISNLVELVSEERGAFLQEAEY